MTWRKSRFLMRRGSLRAVNVVDDDERETVQMPIPGDGFVAAYGIPS